jgi:hypothetical protein
MKRLAFSDDMMRAIAANQKSMTRRPEKRAVPDAKGRMFWKFHTEDPNGFPAPSIRWDGDIAVFRPRHSVGDLVAATCAYLPAKDLETGTAYRFNNPDFTDIGWKSSRIMPAALAPFALRITEVKAERLGQISDEDARREGAVWWATSRDLAGNPHSCFAELWEYVYGRGSWCSDYEKWMWAIGFEIAERRI